MVPSPTDLRLPKHIIDRLAAISTHITSNFVFIFPNSLSFIWLNAIIRPSAGSMMDFELISTSSPNAIIKHDIMHSIHFCSGVCGMSAAVSVSEKFIKFPNISATTNCRYCTFGNDDFRSNLCIISSDVWKIMVRLPTEIGTINDSSYGIVDIAVVPRLHRIDSAIA